MAKEIASDVEVLEAEAEKILADARARAGEIILGAREEAKKILSCQLPLDEDKTESEIIVSKAKAEADEKVKDSEKEAAEISINADKELKEIIDLVVNIVRGKS